MALVRGDLDVNEVALKHALGVEHLALASEEKVERDAGAPVGFVGPHHLDPPRGPARRRRVGARRGQRRDRRRAARLARARPRRSERDAKVSLWADFAQARAGDPCPRCGKPLEIARGIEVGHIFKLGDQVRRVAPLRVPRREGGDAADRDGQLRHRHRAHDGGGGRAEPRRRRHPLAARARAVRDRAGVAEPVRSGHARRPPTRCTRSSWRPTSRCSTTTATSARA